MEGFFDLLKPILEMAAGKYGVVAQVLGIMAMFRVVFKPLVALAGGWVQLTPSMKDNESLKKFMESKAYKFFAFLVDWFASLKLPKA